MNEVKTRSTIIELLEQLKEDKRTIRGWHGMGMPVDHEKQMWGIYETHSPEIKKLNAEIDKAETWLNDQTKEGKSENVNESAMYALGMIQGIKLLLLEVHKRIENNRAPDIVKNPMRQTLKELIDHVNNFPTVAENGKFIVEPNEGYPTFEWIQERRDLIAKHLKG